MTVEAIAAAFRSGDRAFQNPELDMHEVAQLHAHHLHQLVAAPALSWRGTLLRAFSVFMLDLEVLVAWVPSPINWPIALAGGLFCALPYHVLISVCPEPPEPPGSRGGY